MVINCIQIVNLNRMSPVDLAMKACSVGELNLMEAGCVEKLPKAVTFDSRVPTLKKIPPDGGFGYAVVFGSFMISFLVTGFLKSFGVLQNFIFDTFPGTTTSEAAWIPGALNTIALMSSPFSGALCTAFGFRPVVISGGLICSGGLVLSRWATSTRFLTFSVGILMGIGATLTLTCGTVIIGKYFVKNRCGATCVALSGAAVGSLVLPHVCAVLLDNLGLNGTFLVLGVVYLLLCVSGILFAPPENHYKNVVVYEDQSEKIPPEQKSAEIAPHTKEYSQPIKFLLKTCNFIQRQLALNFLIDPLFLLMVATVVPMALGTPHYLHYLPLQAESIGISRRKARYLLTFCAVGDLVARALFGFLSDKRLVKRTVEYLLVILVSAVSIFCLPFFSSYGQLAVASVTAGMGTGVWFSLISLVLADNHGSDNLTGTFSLLRVFQGCSNLAYPPIVGILRETYGTYAVLLFMGFCMFLSVAFALALHLAVTFKHRKTKSEVSIASG